MQPLTTLPTDLFVAAAFAELLADVSSFLDAARAQRPCDKDEIGFWSRQFNALNKAQSSWLQGVRPQLAGDAYLLASASRPGALVHRLIHAGGVVVCSCEAGQRGLLCWHHVLINVVERAAELEALAADRAAEDVAGGGPDQAPPAPAIDYAAVLAARLAATAQILDAMRVQQRQGARLAA